MTEPGARGVPDAPDVPAEGKPTSPQGRPLWRGRFGEGPAEELLEFCESLSFDSRLAGDDLAGSRAHVNMLARVGLISDEERALILAALTRVEEELTSGKFAFLPLDEDIHTAIERRVTELAGPAGAKLHTGRSRNDQVALDLRLYVRREGRELGHRLHLLMDVLLRRAEEAQRQEAYLPGYTHMQRAQPVLLAHHLLAHFWMLGRDMDRLRDALERLDVSPLGAGALAGSTLPLDPAGVAAELGFARAFENSLDAVSNRDFVAEMLFVCALCQVHLSRLGEEVVIWATEEFGFLRLADAYSTGSSMLPQKKNPDIAELVRGKAGRLIGHLAGFLATLKGLPLSYNRDLQEDKEPLFDALDTLSRALAAMAGLMDTATFDLDRMRAAADAPASAAADLAEDLVRSGMPFREAHILVGKVVREAVERGIPLEELVMTEPRLGPDALPALEPGASVRRRTSPGGAGASSVAIQLESARSRLADQEAWLDKGV
ncbi:MAG TPA: argininosuccinate lyase [Acidimicrobiia bacterium]